MIKILHCVLGDYFLWTAKSLNTHFLNRISNFSTLLRYRYTVYTYIKDDIYATNVLNRSLSKNPIERSFLQNNTLKMNNKNNYYRQGFFSFFFLSPQLLTRVSLLSQSFV